MSFIEPVNFDLLLERLRAIAEPTRLRLLAMLAENELNVSDLVEITEQSQPRISRHLKLLQESGVLERIKEGSYVYYKAVKTPLLEALKHSIDKKDSTLLADFEKLNKRRADLNEQALNWFQSHAAEWHELRNRHIDESLVEDAILAMLPQKGESFLDLGTGTGRMLELFSKDYTELQGIDNTPAMLSVARAHLSNAKVNNASVRLGNIYDLDLPENRYDTVIIHQVLHYLDEPWKALKEAAKCLKIRGQILIVDLASHTQEDLRETLAHRRLGFAKDTMIAWLQESHLRPINFQELKPINNHDLTVCLWLAEKV